MSLVTLNDIKTYLGIEISDTSQDTLLAIFQESVEQSVINYCACAFEPTVVTKELYDGLKSDTLVLKNYPVISVQAIYTHPDVDGDNGSLVDSEEYYLEDSAIIFPDYYTPHYRGVIRVDYTHGYTTVPGDVKLAVLQAVKAEFQRKDDNTEHIGSRSKGDESESYNSAWDGLTGLPKQVVNKLNAYKNIEFPVIGMAQRNR